MEISAGMTNTGKGLTRKRPKKGQPALVVGVPNRIITSSTRPWRCGKCEHSFAVKGLGDKAPWWKRLLRR